MVLYTPTYCIVKVDQVYMYVVVYGYAKLLPCNMAIYSYTNIVSYVHALYGNIKVVRNSVG